MAVLIRAKGRTTVVQSRLLFTLLVAEIASVANCLRVIVASLLTTLRGSDNPNSHEERSDEYHCKSLRYSLDKNVVDFREKLSLVSLVILKILTTFIHA